MRALFRGERAVSPWAFSALVGMFCVSVASLMLAVGYHNQLRDLKHVIFTRCSQRTAYDLANHLSVGADIQLYRRLLDEPGMRATSATALREALAVKERAYNAGVIGSCNAYK